MHIIDITIRILFMYVVVYEDAQKWPRLEKNLLQSVDTVDCIKSKILADPITHVNIEDYHEKDTNPYFSSSITIIEGI